MPTWMCGNNHTEDQKTPHEPDTFPEKWIMVTSVFIMGCRASIISLFKGEGFDRVSQGAIHKVRVPESFNQPAFIFVQFSGKSEPEYC